MVSRAGDGVSRAWWVVRGPCLGLLTASAASGGPPDIGLAIGPGDLAGATAEDVADQDAQAQHARDVEEVAECHGRGGLTRGGRARRAGRSCRREAAPSGATGTD